MPRLFVASASFGIACTPEHSPLSRSAAGGKGGGAVLFLPEWRPSHAGLV